jgi:hypothetical protein
MSNPKYLLKIFIFNFHSRGIERAAYVRICQLLSHQSSNSWFFDSAAVEVRLDALVAFGLRTSCMRQANTAI